MIDTFRTLTGAVAAGAVALMAGAMFPQAAFAFDVTCESTHNQRAYCRTSTSGGVHVKTQLSKSSCHQGSTWGYDSRGIWVSNGCRAVFKVGSDRYQSSHHDSHDNNQAAAAIAGLALITAGAIAAHKSHDDHNNDRYDNDYYRYDTDDHDLYYYQHSGSRHYQVTCESRNDRYEYCRAPVHRSYVRLTKRRSHSGCEFHRDWGYDSRGIWVDNGCRADFEIE